MNEQHNEGFTCPECKKHSTHPKDKEFGYCGACHAYTGAAARAAELGDDVPRYTINTGGLMHCCTDAVAAWVVLHLGPWPPGTTIFCPREETLSPTVIAFDGFRWAWAKPA